MTLTLAQLAIGRQIVGYLNSPPPALKIPPLTNAGGYLPTNSGSALAGNVGQECSFDPTLSGDGGVSKYWCQWQGVRLTNYEAWCSANNLSPTSVEAICYVLVELPTSNGAAAEVPWFTDTSVNGQPVRSIDTLTADFCKFFERAGTPDLDNRIAYTKQVVGSVPAAPSIPVTAPVASSTKSPDAVITSITKLMLDLTTMSNDLAALLAAYNSSN